jgi:hypothetical protein
MSAVRRRQVLFVVLGALALAACLWGAGGSPRVRLLNEGLRLEHPPARGAWGLAGAAGLGLLAAAVPRRGLRLTLAACAVLAAALAGQRLLYRLEAGPQALTARGLLGTTALPWREVTRVDTGHQELLVSGTGDTQIRVVTAGFDPELRTTLERAISRRVAESRANAR